MSFKVIEKFILGKSRDISKCEDRIVVTDHFACLIDGATSKSDIDFDSKTQGVIAGELIEKVVRSMPNDITLPSFISEINKQFHSFYAGENARHAGRHGKTSGRSTQRLPHYLFGSP